MGAECWVPAAAARPLTYLWLVQQADKDAEGLQVRVMALLRVGVPQLLV